MRHSNLAIFIPHAGCPHRCVFCDQQQISGQTHMPTSAEIKELIVNCANLPGHRANSAQIAFFGGSFTCISKEKMIEYLVVAAQYVEEGLFTGIRISTRPDGINPEILAILKQHHVESIELGAQSMDPEVLRRSERGHTPADTIKAAELIHQFGFDLGLQMLIGLPGDSKETAFSTAQKLAALNPKEMRLYPAVVFPHTQLHKMYLSGAYHPLSVDDALDWTIPIAYYLERSGIHLLKVGLHQADGAVAGAFHPAFGELVRTGIWNMKLKESLPASPCSIQINVPSHERSIAIGQKKQNIIFWKKAGYHLKIISDPNKPYGIIK